MSEKKSGFRAWMVIVPVGALLLLAATVVLALFLINRFKKTPPPPVYVNSYEFVDMGLSVLWATNNVGAVNIYDKGNYYAWGEYAPKYKYSHTNYEYGIRNDNKQFTKYIPYDKYEYSSYYSYPDGKTVLESYDDAVNRNWGSPCRLPSRAECQELLDKCTRTWVVQNGMPGILFTADNGNSVFFPAGGFFKSDNVRDDHEKGYYLTSTLNLDRPDMCYRLLISHETADSYSHSVESSGRYYGYCARAVVDRYNVN